ncbi:uncharacterized protein LOC118202589, partial [Stegodyphus dumicola]|uniref:uncharacterized protein LOC118202589 n=1 Tax=Stegodyphus dumicola TaxID=202533 RepID=UPI0015A80FD1
TLEIFRDIALRGTEVVNKDVNTSVIPRCTTGTNTPYPEVVTSSTNTDSLPVTATTQAPRNTGERHSHLKSATTPSAIVPQKPTFAAVLKQFSKPSLIINPLGSIHPRDLRTQLQEKVPLSEIPVVVNAIKPAPKGGLEVFCNTNEEVLKLQEHIKKAEVQAEVRLRQKRQPRIAIHNVPEHVKPEQLIAELSATAGLSARVYKPLFRLKERRANRVKWVLECTTESFGIAINIRRLFTAWQAHTITEFLGIRRCYRCQQFGHSQDLCRSKKQFCAFCAGSHNTKVCQAESPACINCGDCNYRNGTSYYFEHPAYHPECPMYQRAVYNTRCNTQY